LQTPLFNPGSATGEIPLLFFGLWTFPPQHLPVDEVLFPTAASLLRWDLYGLQTQALSLSFSGNAFAARPAFLGDTNSPPKRVEMSRTGALPSTIFPLYVGPSYFPAIARFLSPPARFFLS